MRLKFFYNYLYSFLLNILNMKRKIDNLNTEKTLLNQKKFSY